MSDSSGSALEQSVRRMFVKWLVLSTAAILAVALISGARATAADVFIDEGEGDFDKPTPVETPVSNSGLEFDLEFKSPNGDILNQTPTSDPASTVVETATILPLTAEAIPPKAVVKEKAAKAKSEKVVKVVKKTAKASTKSAKAAAKNGKAKSGKKALAVVKSKKKAVASKSKVVTKKTSKRKVASAVKYAGGQYVSTSRECTMESAPGAGDAIGTTKAQRKLWVEDAGDAGYWKVYSKSGQAAFLSRSCF